MHALLSSTPVFQNGQFDLTCIYSAGDLHSFTMSCQKLGLFVEAQFSLPIRSDIEKKPTTQLHWFLKMVGISTIKSSKKIGKDKIYQYMIDPDSYNSMIALIDLRNSEINDWTFINQLHGFQNIQKNPPTKRDN